jgi:hypothetical protein
MTACANPKCTRAVDQRATGRPRRFCSRDCREAAQTSRTVRTHGRRNEVLRTRVTTNTDPGVLTDSSLIETGTCRDENGDLQQAPLRWIEINTATHKLTDGVMERTPACHGKWPASTSSADWPG